MVLKFFLVISHVVVMVLIVSSAVLFSDPSDDEADAPQTAPRPGPTHSVPVSPDGDRSYVFLDYRLDVPTHARRIDGIELQFDAFVTDASVATELIAELSWDGGLTWTDAGHRTPPLRTGELNYMLGSAIDDWGHRWTASELNDAGRFRVRLSTAGADDEVVAVFSDVAVRISSHPTTDHAFHRPTRAVERSR